MGLISLIKPLKRYEDYVYRANTYETYLLRRKAIQTMEQAVLQSFSKEELSSGFIYLGILYSKIKNYSKASECYHRGLELMINDDFKYSSNFKQAIITFIKSHDKERAEFWLNNLLQRQNYDKKFLKLSKLTTQM